MVLKNYAPKYEIIATTRYLIKGNCCIRLRWQITLGRKYFLPSLRRPNNKDNLHKSASCRVIFLQFIAISIALCQKGHLNAVICVEFDAFRLFTGSMDRSIRIWDIRSGRSIHKLYGHKVCIIPDPELLFSRYRMFLA